MGTPLKIAAPPDELAAGYQYMDDVLNDRIVVGSKIKQLVKRHWQDIETARERGFYFSEAHAVKGVRFVSMLRHTKGLVAKKRFQLQPWQVLVIMLFDGWRRIDDHGRRFKVLFLTVARKNGKTEFIAAFAVKAMYADNEYGADIYFCATKREQAKIGFSAAKTMTKFLMQDSPKAFNATKILRNEISIQAFDSQMTYVSSDYDTLDGYNPHMAIIDEYHAHKTSGVLDVMRTGQGARNNPILGVTTTAGFNINGPCYLMQRVCGEVLQGFKQDDSLLPVIHTLDAGDDWNDEALWGKPNPNLGVSIDMKFLREQYVTAVNEGASKEIQFKTKNLNIWTSASTTWIQDREWMACTRPIDMGMLRGRRCYLGLDLASVRDLAALAMIFPMDDGSPDVVIVYHYMPKKNSELRERNDGIPFSRWAQETDRLTITEGSVTDYRSIRQKIQQIAELYDLRSIAYDRYNASQLIIELQDQGFVCNPFGQGFVSMNTPTKAIEKAVVSERICHDGDPILRWEMGNVMLRSDPAGNIKVDKEKSAEKVDGIVATVMAYGEMMDGESGGGSGLETYGIRSL